MLIVRMSDGDFVKVTVPEALELIRSLTTQILEDSPNCGRVEAQAKVLDYSLNNSLPRESSKYFSIAVLRGLEE